MDRRRLCLVLFALGLAVPTGGASTDTTGCKVYTYPAAPVGAFYLYDTEVWQEDNGVPGLQRVIAPCDGGRAPIAPDACVTHQENRALVTCGLSYSMSVLP